MKAIDSQRTYKQRKLILIIINNNDDNKSKIENRKNTNRNCG